MVTKIRCLLKGLRQHRTADHRQSRSAAEAHDARDRWRGAVVAAGECEGADHRADPMITLNYIESFIYLHL